MNSEDYKTYWQSFENNPYKDYSMLEIETIITHQSKEASTGLKKHLKFDILLKIAVLIGLAWIVYLFRNTSFFYPLSISAIAGSIASIRQALLIKHLKNMIDYTMPVRVVIAAVFKQARRNLNIAGLLVGFTNPLIILAGSFIYYFNTYGLGFKQTLEDTLVTILLMLIGFVFGYAAFSMQQNSLLNDLEISLEILDNESNDTIELVAGRRKRRTAMTIALIVLGVAVFLILLASYLYVF